MEEKKESSYFGFRIILFLFSIPLSLIVSRWLPQIIIPISDGFDLQPYISFIATNILLQIILFPFRKVLSVIASIGIIIIAFLIYKGKIEKKDLRMFFEDSYQKVTNQTYFGHSIANQISIEKAIKNDKGLTDFIESHKKKYDNYDCLSKPILMSFAMFDNISCKWNYVNDPEHMELFRPVSETIITKSGDCDDHAICLSSCMKKCGARSRIIHTDGHLYPELYVGKIEDKQKVKNSIRDIYSLSPFKKIYIYEDKDELWISMDYTGNFPGSKHLGFHRFETFEL